MQLHNPWSARARLLTLASAVIVTLAGHAAASEDYRPLSIGGSSVRWSQNPSGEPTTLKFAIATRDVDRRGAVNCGHTRPPEGILARSRIDRAAFKAAVATAFARWERAARLRFVEVADQDAADILIGEQAEPTGRAFTNLALGGTAREPARPIVHATICLNPERRWKIGFDGDLTSYDLVHTLTHEIGHSIGLDHPGARGHVMSFRYDEAHTALTAGDVLGARTLYGAADAQSALDVDRSIDGPASAPDVAVALMGRDIAN